MPRNSSGTMSPANGPYIGGTTISTVAVNARFSDIESEITDSASRSGKGGFTAPVRTADGTVAAPAVSFTSEPGDGMYRAGTGDVRLAVGGVDALKLASGGVSGPLNLAAGTPSIVVTVAASQLALQGNLAATTATTAADVSLGATAARTAGNLVRVYNNNGAADALYINYQGLLQLASQATAIQPASIWTAITPNAGWTLAITDTGYHKDALGFVHVRGGLTNNTGAATANILTTTPLPTGFRPTLFRLFAASTGGATPTDIQVNADGTIVAATSIPNGGSVYLDVIHFMAQQ